MWADDKLWEGQQIGNINDKSFDIKGSKQTTFDKAKIATAIYCIFVGFMLSNIFPVEWIWLKYFN